MKLDTIDECIWKCAKCKNLVEKFPKAKTIHFGIDNDIVLIGEAPANNGWRKSSMVWRDVNGKMLPSGVILQKLFDEIGRDILDTTFIEAIKCFPVKRSNIPVCLENCKSILISQLECLKPKVVITLGDAATRSLLGNSYKNFKEVAGKLFYINGLNILPIYHPSPVSPMSYKGNIPIFEKLRDGGYEIK